MKHTKPLAGSENQEAVLRVSDLTLMQGARVLVRDAAFHLPPRCLALLTGANGQGKTTLLRAIMGLHAASAGEIRIFGHAAGSARDAIGYLPQERRIPAPQLAAQDFITSAWRARHLGFFNVTSACRREVARVCDLVDVTNVMHRPIGQLSGGEKQRVFLAIALLGRPRLLLLDEPLTSIDHAGATRLVALMETLSLKMDMTILLSTHHGAAFDKLDTMTLHLAKGHLKVRHAGI